MPRKSLEIKVEPKILSWARGSVGRNIDEVAKILKVNKDMISKWESGQQNLKLTQLEKLSKIYKRPLAVFFLPEPPKEQPLPKDFRTLPAEKRVSFSYKTLLAIRRARRLQSLANELARGLNREILLNINKVSLSDNPEVLANNIRIQLGIEVQTQFNWKDENEAFNVWKKVIEQLNILIFQISMPIEELRAFSLIEYNLPIIVLNSKDSARAKIFSLFHEYGHLILNSTGICDMFDESYISDEVKQIEKFCNHLSGAILVPRDNLLNHPLVENQQYFSKSFNEVLEKLSKEFKVSQEVILRRLLILEKISDNFYKRKRKEFLVLMQQKQKRWGRLNIPKKCIQENGVPFVSLVLETYKEKKITYTDVSDYLGIRLKYLPKVEQLIGGEI